ncbi:Extradiol ring-cleavage dioxygenase class III enzyme subunit B [Trametopsis cervina]|nr:Extradiol ring-cleavage dioxygenase class III enzyme subunit B [Trametopsis cervina]
MSDAATLGPRTSAEWKAALDSLPANPNKIPAFYFGHGSPMMAFPEESQRVKDFSHLGPNGPLAKFLKDFGPTLLDKYNPKAIVVFSAHWDIQGEQLVSDYGDVNPLYYDYYGFPASLYQLHFKSRGDSAISQRVVQLFRDSGIPARTSPATEMRGVDGLQKMSSGLDHGVFVPFRIMFGEEFTDIPIIEVSFDGTLDPEANWRIGQAVKKLREEKILILSGGLTIHNLRDFASFSEESAAAQYKAFDRAVLAAASEPDGPRRKDLLKKLTAHSAYHIAHPRADHFVPIYVAAGAGEDGGVKIISGIYGQPTIAFGL